MTSSSVGPTLYDLFVFIRKGLWLAIPLGLLFGGAGYLVSQVQNPVYTAQTTLLAASGDIASNPFGVSLTTASNLDALSYKTAALSDAVVSKTLKDMGLKNALQETLTNFRKRIKTTSEETRSTSVITLYFQGRSPQEAADGANLLAENLTNWDQNRATRNLDQVVSSLESEITDLRRQIITLNIANDAQAVQEYQGVLSLIAQKQAQLSSAKVLRESSSGHLEITQPAAPPGEATYPRPLLSTLAASVLGILLAYIFIFLHKLLGKKVRTVDELSRLGGPEVAAVFPRKYDKALGETLASFLRVRLLNKASLDKPVVILITSALAEDGKRNIAAGLAKSFAGSNQPTLFIDADMSTQGAKRQFGLDEWRLSETRHIVDPEKSAQPQPVTEGSCLAVVTNINGRATYVIKNFKKYLEAWGSNYEVVVVNVAPLLSGADALTIAPFCDTTVLVARLTSTGRGNLKTATSVLNRLQIPRVEIVVTNAPYGSWRETF